MLESDPVESRPLVSATLPQVFLRTRVQQSPSAALTLGLKVSYIVHCAVAAVNTIPSADVWAAAICSCMEKKKNIHQSQSKVTHVL